MGRITRLINEIKVSNEPQNTAEVRMALQVIQKAIPHIKGRIPVGDRPEIDTAKKAVETFQRFTDTLVKDIKKDGLSDKVKKGLKNYLNILDKNINPDIMKVIDRKQKSVKLAIDSISRSASFINTIMRIEK